MPGSFLDSNIVLYLASEDLLKADRAQELVAEGGTISVQVLNEIANISRRKMGLSWAETRNFLLMIRGLLKVEPITIEIHDVGISLAERYQLSVYDSMIVSAALSAECDTLLSEDLQDCLSTGDCASLIRFEGDRPPNPPKSKLFADLVVPCSA
jgi:predicted nucleic acid-binding protein